MVSRVSIQDQDQIIRSVRSIVERRRAIHPFPVKTIDDYYSMIFTPKEMAIIKWVNSKWPDMLKKNKLFNLNFDNVPGTVKMVCQEDMIVHKWSQQAIAGRAVSKEVIKWMAHARQIEDDINVIVNLTRNIMARARTHEQAYKFLPAIYAGMNRNSSRKLFDIAQKLANRKTEIKAKELEINITPEDYRRVGVIIAEGLMFQPGVKTAVNPVFEGTILVK